MARTAFTLPATCAEEPAKSTSSEPACGSKRRQTAILRGSSVTPSSSSQSSALKSPAGIARNSARTRRSE